jgi:hypothetical protein
MIGIAYRVIELARQLVRLLCDFTDPGEVSCSSCPVVGSLQDGLSHMLDGLEPGRSVWIPVWSGVWDPLICPLLLICSLWWSLGN